MFHRFTVPAVGILPKYQSTISDEAGSYRKAALQDYNALRDHNFLPPLKRLPNGTCFSVVFDYCIEMYTSEGWEEVCSEGTRKEALVTIKEYRENQPGAYRIKKKPATEI